MKKLLIAMLMSIGYSQIVLESDLVGDTVIVVGDYNIAKANTPVSYTDVDKEQIETFEGQENLIYFQVNQKLTTIRLKDPILFQEIIIK